MELIKNWFRRYFSDPQVVILALLLIIGFVVVIYFGDMLAPVLASVVIAYLLEGLIGFMDRYRVPRLLSVIFVCVVFLTCFILALVKLLPLLQEQLIRFFKELPTMLEKGQEILNQLSAKFPSVISPDQIDKFKKELQEYPAKALSVSLTSLVEVIKVVVYLVVYLILVPLLIFFFLKDKHRILAWFSSYVPKDRGLAVQVWRDVDIQIGNYVRGKFWEIIIIGSASYVTFQFMGLNYSILLAVMVGLSVIVPYIGATVVTIPVALVAYSQWGITSDFTYVMVAYLVIQMLDGNVLVPLLFSEVVNLHPIAIIVAVLIFGGVWGFWGVFFAIPLATLVQSVLKAWPRPQFNEASDVAAASS